MFACGQSNACGQQWALSMYHHAWSSAQSPDLGRHRVNINIRFVPQLRCLQCLAEPASQIHPSRCAPSPSNLSHRRLFHCVSATSCGRPQLREPKSSECPSQNEPRRCLVIHLCQICRPVDALDMSCLTRMQALDKFLVQLFTLHPPPAPKLSESYRVLNVALMLLQKG